MVTKLLMILAVLVVLFTAGIAPTPARASGIRVVLGAPIAYFLGSLIAVELLGLSARQVLDNQIDHATGMLIFVTTVCLFVSWILWNRTELSLLRAQAEAEKAKSAAVERQAMQAQLQLLQAQIEPQTSPFLSNSFLTLAGSMWAGSSMGISTVSAPHFLNWGNSLVL